jgi:hypothetical protein
MVQAGLNVQSPRAGRLIGAGPQHIRETWIRPGRRHAMSPRRKTMIAALGLTGLAVLAGCNPATGNVAAGADKAAPVSNLSPASANSATSPDANAQDSGVPENAVEGDALVPATGFNATATVRCVTRAGRAPRDCSAGVVRHRDGTAIVTIFWPEGRSRAIFFDASHRAFGADTSEADGSASQPFRATRERGNSTVTIGPERYVIPDSFVLAG